MVEKVGEIVGLGRPGGVVFLTEDGDAAPLLPGARPRERAPRPRQDADRRVLSGDAGQYGLRFLEFYPEDGNYRAT